MRSALASLSTPSTPFTPSTPADQDADDNEARAAREAELLQVLSSYADPRAVSYRFVLAFVLLGLLLSASVAFAGARSRRQQPFRFEAAMPASFARGVRAYENGDWDEALKAMQEAQRASTVPAPRLVDYIERLALVQRDGERLAKADEALDADEPERALVLAALVAPNSPLFSQAEGLGRKARARLELDMHTDRVLHEEPTLVDPQPPVRDTVKPPRRPRVSRAQEPADEGAW